jgi:hypothetical protein
LQLTSRGGAHPTGPPEPKPHVRRSSTASRRRCRPKWSTRPPEAPLVVHIDGILIPVKDVYYDNEKGYHVIELDTDLSGGDT